MQAAESESHHQKKALQYANVEMEDSISVWMHIPDKAT